MKTVTKHSLWVSGLSLLLCAALLLGTTFAWFTDSVTNTGNVITAGTLSIGASAYDVDTSKDTYQFAGINNGQAFGFKGDGQDLKAENCPPILSEPRWEPGVSNAKLLTVSNNGSLAANIRLSFDVEDNGLQDALWFDFIQVEPVQGSFVKRPMSELNTLAQSMVIPLNGGESVSFILVYGMDEQADNAFQGKSFSADVTVMATQASKEEDGFGSSDYDAAADGAPDHPEWATGGTAQVTKPADGWAEETVVSVPGASVTVPDDAISGSANALKLTVIRQDGPSAGGNVPVQDGQGAQYYDIALTGLNDGNTLPVSVQMQVGAKRTNVKLFSGTDEIPFTYDAATGLLTFSTASFGPFAVVYDLPWDGSVDAEGLEANTNAAAKTVTVDTPAQLAALAQKVNAGTTYAGYTVTLTRDMDLSGANWTPIGVNGKMFRGAFDGGDHVIFGLQAVNNLAYGNGFFGNIAAATVRNVTIDGAFVSRYGSSSGSISGNVYGIVSAYAYGNVTFENVHVKNSSIRGYGKVGAVLGMAAEPGSSVTALKNCTVENVSVTVAYNGGGLIGLAQNVVELTGCTTEKVEAHLADSASKYVDVDTTATQYVDGQPTGKTMPVKGKFWVYPYQGVDLHYAAWGDYYTDYYYEMETETTGWKLEGVEGNAYIADGLCHNK